MRGALLSALLALLLATPASAAKPKPPASPSKPGVPVARVSFQEGLLEQAAPDGAWRRAEEGTRVKTGDRVRTGPTSTARLEFPFMDLVVGPSSLVSIPPSAVLSTVLEEGRIQQHAEGGDIIKLRTAEAEIRGGGRVVVRRKRETTLVTVVDGRFRVGARGKSVTLVRGQGTLVAAGEPPLAVDLHASPADLAPGADPVYVIRGQPVSLSWRSSVTSHHLQILGIGGDEVLMARDVEGTSLSVEIPWLGTFRWRVSARDERGLESLPSIDGHVCAVEK